MRNMTTLMMVLLGGLTIGGCATGPTNVDRDFGNSVRQMVAGQTQDPAAAENPDPKALDGGDGERLNAALEVYRTDVARPEEVGQPIVISVGGQ
jgi:type IV pilus biogenesis protein CpaD/CtpE